MPKRQNLSIVIWSFESHPLNLLLLPRFSVTYKASLAEDETGLIPYQFPTIIQGRGSHLKLKKDGTAKGQHLSFLGVAFPRKRCETVTSGTPASLKRPPVGSPPLCEMLFPQSHSHSGTKCRETGQKGGFGAPELLGNRPLIFFGCFGLFSFSSGANSPLEKVHSLNLTKTSKVILDFKNRGLT